MTLQNLSAHKRSVGAALALACLTLVATATTAFANFGPHAPGGTLDTDTCAMCHRVHSSFSTINFEPRYAPPEFNYVTDGPNALLVGSAATVTEFCLACHGSGAPGAGTNVIQGVFESSAFITSSTPAAPLNGGGFGSMPDPYGWNASSIVSDTASTSRHDLDTGPVPLWAEGTSLATRDAMSCTSCHDPHPTSNYRMLRGSINGTTVGGYTGAVDETPNAFVFSTETSFPIPGADPSNPNGGFLKGAAGAAQVSAYRPNYTGGSPILNTTQTTPNKSLSVWCASCHTGYRQTSAAATVVVNYGIYEANPVTGVQIGTLERHFHPVDKTLETGFGPTRSLAATVLPDQAWVPLEKAQGGTGEFYKDYIGCLTCHRAHGSSTIMTGWAASHLETNALGAWTPVQDSTPGIPPAKEVYGGSPAVGSSALLRTNNRGVCERCHGG